MTLSKARALSAVLVFTAGIMSGCGGSDSTGPGSIDSNAALQSLTLGLQTIGPVGAPATPVTNASFGDLAPLLDQVNVTIDGTSEAMFALGLRETFPAGTCDENLFFAHALPPLQLVCTPPRLGLALILWQAHSATQRPDRLIFILADAGTSNFDFASTQPAAAAGIALYVEGQNSAWTSLSGTLASQVTATSQTCNFPLPPYAKSGGCKIATFDEQGSIVFEPVSLDAPSTKRVSLGIPHMTLHGLWIEITELQPVPLTGSRLIPGFLGARLMSMAPQPTPAR